MNIDPYAIVTIRLPRSMTGQEISEIVKTTRSGGQDEFYLNRRYRDGDRIGFGRASHESHKNVAVQPSAETEWFDPDADYVEIVVLDDETHADWTYGAGYVDAESAYINSVRAYADALRVALI